MVDLFYNFCRAGDIKIKSAYAIYNPTLVAAFASQLQIIQSRITSDPFLFSSKSYLIGDKHVIEGRQFVKGRFDERVADCAWNSDPMNPVIIPTIHGTSVEVAWKVCATGFANLSTLDSGFYGKGIYFTTYAMYAVPYFSKASSPAIVISFVLPGHTFPVIEDPTLEKGIVGTALKSGFNSHYAVTNTRGLPHKIKDSGVCFDEIVIPQEAQITPVLLIEISTTNLLKLEKALEKGETGTGGRPSISLDGESMG